MFACVHVSGSMYVGVRTAVNAYVRCSERSCQSVV